MRGVGDRAAKWMRYIARALTVIWAGLMGGFLVLVLLADPGSGAITAGRWDLALPELLKVVLFFVVPAAIPWLWEAVGGIVLVVAGFVVPIVYVPRSEIIGWFPWFGLPPLVAGILFLASWWRSRRAEPQGLRQRREYMGFLVANVGAAGAYAVQRLREWWGGKEDGIMTGVRKTTDRVAKLMRYIARGVALIWAGCWSFFAVGQIFDPIAPISIPPRTSEDLIGLLMVASVVLLLCGGAAIPWRWEAIGGVVLMLEGLLAFIWALVQFADYPEGIVLVLPIVALPPVVAGILFLASWGISGRPIGRQNR